MKLYKIDIENFRSFSKLTMEDFRNLNLIVGKNNCGKTSILEAIFLSIGASNPELALRIDKMRGLLHDEEEDFKFIFHKLNYNGYIKINTEFIDKPQYRNLIISPTFDDPVKNINLETGPDSTLLSSDDDINGITFNFSIKTSPHSEKDKYKSSLRYLSEGITVEYPNNYREKLRGVFIRPTTSSSELYNKLDKILIKKDESKFIKSLHHIDNKIEDISLGAKNMIYFDIGIDQLIPIQIMGDGIIRFLNILATIAYVKDGIVLIDEIENGFHHSILPKLWDSILLTAKQFNVQVFATTHSYECVKAFNKTCLNQNQLYKEDCLRLFRIEKSNGEFKTVKFDSEILESTLESNWEIR